MRLRACTACPHGCEVDRWEGERGRCGVGRDVVVASAFAHHGEEHCLVGRHGSGTIFFAGCNLACVFCQNADISGHTDGRAYRPGQLADLMLGLQDAGCHNVNLVSPSHVVPQLAAALTEARVRGLRVPVVYNCGGYDSATALGWLDGLVDIYMPDAKFWDPGTASRYCGASDYPQRLREALRVMHAQVGDLAIGPDGLARRGLLVRHLVLPELGGQTAAILRWLARELSPDTFVNLLAQYRPCHRVGCPSGDGRPAFPELARRPSPQELAAAAAGAREAGLWRLEGAACD
jgi:putative pyruvate formate lyase activating enzyme